MLSLPVYDRFLDLVLHPVFVRTILLALIATPLFSAFHFPLSLLIFEKGDLPVLVDVEDL